MPEPGIGQLREFESPPSAYSNNFSSCALIDLRKARERELATLDEKPTISGCWSLCAKKYEGNNRGGEGKDDTCDHGLYVQKLESISVQEKKKKKLIEEMINPQSAAIRSTSSTKQHKFICQLRTNTRPLALDRQTTTATDSKTTARTKPAILPSTYHHLRVAQLNNRRNLYNATLEAPGTQPTAMLLCGFSWRTNRNHHYLLLV